MGTSHVLPTFVSFHTGVVFDVPNLSWNAVSWHGGLIHFDPLESSPMLAPSVISMHILNAPFLVLVPAADVSRAHRANGGP